MFFLSVQKNDFPLEGVSFFIKDLTLIELKQHNLMPSFRANARLSPRGGKLLKSQRLQSCSSRGKDVRRTGRGL